MSRIHVIRVLVPATIPVIRTPVPGPPGPQGPEDSDLSTKSSVIDWDRVPTLSLGTSIPHQGGDIDSYMVLAVGRLGGTVKNNSWAGSAARYDVLGDPFAISTVKRLSMTQDDVDWGLATYGSGSVYDDDFELINKASQMTCDYRIDQAFQETPFQVVFFDHNHNDRDPLYFGTAVPDFSTNIVSVTKGATTQITLDSIGSIVVGDGIVLELTGIESLNHAAQRVQAVAGNVITVNIDSSGYSGTFTSGTCTKYDRATLHGSFRFLYHRIRRAAYLAGVEDVKVIFCGAPSDYTNGAYDSRIRESAEVIRTIADELGCAFFDVASRYEVTDEYQETYFEDTVHPLTEAQRVSLSNIWSEWLGGGAVRTTDPTLFIPAPVHAIGTTPVYVDQSPVHYSRFLGGAGTPNILLGEEIEVFSEDFSSGFGSWTLNGTVPPTIEAAPWGGGDSAIECVVPGPATGNSYISRSVVLGRGRVVEFDFWLPEVIGLGPTGNVYQATLFELRSSGAYYLFSLRIVNNGVTFLSQYFKGPNVNLGGLSPSPIFTILPDTKYRLRYEMYQGTSVDDPGRLVAYVDGVRVGGPYTLEDHDQTAIASMRVGAIGVNTTLPFTVYIGNLVVSELPVDSFAERFTGTANGIDFVAGYAVSSDASVSSGDWTPGFAFATPGDSVITYTLQTGKYLKIGNAVFVTFEIRFNTNAYTTAAGVAEYNGLPFVAAAPGGALAIGDHSLITWTKATFDLQLVVPASGTKAMLRQVSSNGSAAATGTTNFPASKTGIYMRGSGMYWTDE